MTIEEHSRRYELLTKLYSGGPMRSGITDQQQAQPQLDHREQTELDWLEAKLLAEYEKLP